MSASTARGNQLYNLYCTEKNPVQVLSVTGGIGKTNIAVNLAIGLSKLGKRVMLFDADLSLANINIILGLKLTKDISHVISGEVSLQDIIIEGPENVLIIPSSSGVQELTDLSDCEHAGLIRAFSEIGQQVDVLIVDNSAGISNSVIRFNLASQEIVIAVCNEPTSINDAYVLIRTLNYQYARFKFHILANMVRDANEGEIIFQELLSETEKLTDVSLNYLGSIPYDDKIRKAVQEQNAVLESYPSCQASQRFLQLAKKITALPITTIPEGNLEFFVERIISSQLLK